MWKIPIECLSVCKTILLRQHDKRKLQNLGTCPKLPDPLPLTPLWEQKNVGTFYFLKTPFTSDTICKHQLINIYLPHSSYYQLLPAVHRVHMKGLKL